MLAAFLFRLVYVRCREGVEPRITVSTMFFRHLFPKWYSYGGERFID
jgi:hypothetical protein